MPSFMMREPSILNVYHPKNVLQAKKLVGGKVSIPHYYKLMTRRFATAGSLRSPTCYTPDLAKYLKFQKTIKSY